MNAIFDEWTSGNDYATRVANISGTGSGPRANGNFFLQPDITIVDDALADMLTGGSEMDWFLYNFADDTLGQGDPEGGEIETNLAC